MKKLLIAVTLIISLMFSANAFALSKNQVALGGIPLDASLEYVNSIYGHPKHIDGGRIWVSHYGNGFLVYSSSRPYIGNSKYKPGVNYVDQVLVNQNNGIATPDGAYVGMKENVIQSLYGDAFRTFTKEGGIKVYWYFAGTELLEFEAKGGVVTQIRICETD